MKKLFLSLMLLILATASTMAIPAKKGQWTTLRLTDGTEVRAQLMGDEHAHWWTTADGRHYTATADGLYAPADMEQLQLQALSRRARANAAMARQMRKVSMGDRTHYTGQKKGLVILVQYTDVKFRTGNDQAKYKRILNEEGYSEGNFKGSVSDYFKAQSGGDFELDFDVAGPYTLKHNQRFYGQNDSSGSDMRPDSMIVEAVRQADAEVDFSDYDWDGDGEVDQVFVLYAGKGEADGGYNVDNTVWPHMYNLAETGAALTLDGVRIDTYACSNEVDASNSIEGIGCFCHEFSHCMGYPDLYDTASSGYSSNYGMGSWDLMCSGSYNGNTFRPAGYSAYEKWMAGWIEPIVLDDKDMDIDNLKPTSQGGDAYIIYNKAHTDEYYIIDNRQKSGWDTSLPGRGLMIQYVDFDKQIWEYNIPNSTITAGSPYVTWYGYPVNDHQRVTFFHADNTASDYNESTDLYPYNKRDSLTNTSTPKASLHNKNTDGSLLMNKGITQIKQNSDGTMSFHFRSTAKEQPADDPGNNPEVGEELFYESFNQCDGRGGNDGQWTTTIASSTFTPDVAGWDYLKAFGGYQCARFGNGSTVGEATTPPIQLGTGTEATLTFKAAAWNEDGNALSLSLDGDATLDATELTMKSFEWTDYSLTLSGSGTVRIKFMPVKRFLLDEVRVVKTAPATPTGISERRAASNAQATVCDLQGRRIPAHSATLKKGLYIINGKKTIVK